MKRIAIVGGGPSGVFSAFLLEQKSSEKLDITIFEESGRLGGKVLTKRFDAVPIIYEAGVAELYRYGDDPLWLLVTRLLGLSVVNMTGSTVVLDGRILRTEADIERHFGKDTAAALREFHQRGRALRPFREFYKGGWPADNRHPWTKLSLRDLLAGVTDEVARRFIQLFIHSDLATEPHLTNGLYGIDNYLINDGDYCQLYSIHGGIERLIQAVAERVSARVMLSARVDGVEKTGGEAYRVIYEHGGKTESDFFDAAVVALPVYSLRQLSWGGRLLRTAMERHVARYDDPAHYLRITALFKDPFWRGVFNESYFIHEAFGGCCVYDEGTRHEAGSHGVLSWLLSGNDALAISGCSDDVLIEKALGSLPAGIADAAAARERFIEGHVDRWIGMVNGMPGGRPIEGSRKRHHPEPKEHQCLILVGDYLFDSTINGAFDSADITTDMLLDRLGVARNVLGPDYFDYYCAGNQSYEDSFEIAFDAEHVVDMLEAVWGASPTYRLLDAGSANGLTLGALSTMDVDAWGIENSWYIHAKTPPNLRERNILGDVCTMPFPDGYFDFVYETCLSYVPAERLDAALKELYRVTRRGVMFGSITTDMTPALIKKHALLSGVVSAFTLKQWSERFLQNGFRPAITDPNMMAAVWKIEKNASEGRSRYPSPASMKYRFYEKPQAPRP
jgi:protoporphyrinogen oxidase/SAM-dependent methyltransferase